MKELILNVDENFNGVEYIIRDDNLYLDVNAIHRLTDSPLSTIGFHCKKVLEEYEEHFAIFPTSWKNLYIDEYTGRRPKRFYIHHIVGDVLHRLKSPKAFEFRFWANDKTFKKPEQSQIPMEETIEVIEWLEEKIHEETKLALNAKTNKDFEMHVDSACKYKLEAKKCRFQLENVENCIGKYLEHIESIKQGKLTESDDRRVFLPKIQTTLLDYK